jgi:hypothetical protein
LNSPGRAGVGRGEPLEPHLSAQPPAHEPRLATTKRLTLTLAALLCACGGGGGGDSGSGGSGGSGGANASPAPVEIVVSGVITFDFVPVVLDGGIPRLDYAATEPRPARGVTVEAVRGASVLATATTDSAGRYALPLEADTDGVQILARAEMLRAGTPSWDFRVVDNTQSNALWVLESTELATGRADLTRDLHAASGWDGVAYAATRSAAPFAILDVVYAAAWSVLDAVPSTAFPPLVLHWSPDNIPSRADDGRPDFTSGEIGSSLFAPGIGVFVLGAADSDTDEYDRHVIAHEWGHYLEHAFSRSDSVGGPHTRGDQLDMRTAFSEGFANAFSAIALGDTVYKDTLGPDQSLGFRFDVEGPFFPSSPNPHPGWFSEESIQELIYDLFDDATDIPEDTLAFGLAPIIDALGGTVRDSVALTSIFPFIRALKEAFPAEEARIDDLVRVHEIADISDHYGSGQDNAGMPTNGGTGTSGDTLTEGLDLTAEEQGSDVLPIYKDIAVNGPAVHVCSTDDYRSGVTGSVNKLGSRAFLRFDVESAGTHTFTATATVVPDGEIADPDLRLHRRGLLAPISDASPDEEACTVEDTSGCVESFSRSLGAGDYVLEVYEWTNITTDSDYPPIGRTCFAVEITR